MASTRLKVQTPVPPKRKEHISISHGNKDLHIFIENTPCFRVCTTWANYSGIEHREVFFGGCHS
jgi:hypothetical protein